MKESNEVLSQIEEHSAKREYVEPQLVTHGGIEELTQGGLSFDHKHKGSCIILKTY